MTPDTRHSRRVPVVAAALLVLVLAALLVVRVSARQPQAEGANSGASVSPARASLTSLEIPCWSCPQASEWPLQFRTDLDLLAPLGTGTGNAAEFFAAFEKERGTRSQAALAFMERRAQVAGLEDFGSVVPGNDPLLLEAEPWCDQATMRFYPDLFPLEGYQTRITNLLFMLTLSRSWIVRGISNPDPVAGLEDCRRAIRLGRLLRQEDMVLINDLVGLASIQLGARGMYRIAQRTGDTELALLASVVIGEAAPQRLYTSERINLGKLCPYLHRDRAGHYSLELPDSRLDELVQMVTSSPERRFRGEGLLSTQIVLHYGTPAQQQRAAKVLDDVAAGSDPLLASLARWNREHQLPEQLLEGCPDSSSAK